MKTKVEIISETDQIVQQQQKNSFNKQQQCLFQQQYCYQDYQISVNTDNVFPISYSVSTCLS